LASMRALVATAAAAATAGACVLLRGLLRRQVPRLKLTYFDIPGFGDRIRLTLAIGGIDFEDERLPSTIEGYEEVARRREAGLLPFGQIPVVVIDECKTYAQSNALLRYFGRQARPTLYPDGIEQLQCDMVLEAFADMDARLAPQHYGAAMSRSPTTGKPAVLLSEAQKAELTRELVHDVLPTMLGRIERVLLSTDGPYFCGSLLTICDVVSYSIVTGIRDGSYVRDVGESVFDGCPALLAHASAVANLPAVKTWVRARR